MIDPASIALLLTLWLVLSLPVAVLIGRCIRAGQAADAVRMSAYRDAVGDRRLSDAA